MYEVLGLSIKRLERKRKEEEGRGEEEGVGEGRRKEKKC